MLYNATLHDAILFVGAGAVMALVAMRWKPPLRGGLTVNVVLMLVALGGLAALVEWGTPLSRRAFVVLRELALLLVALGFIGTAMTFVMQCVLARLALPRILSDVIAAFALIAFALYRMNANEVNLASIITTSAVITGVIAFSLQETLGNLWGGIALQLDNTCRLGDWVRVENVMGQVVGIRWRYMALATNNGETIIVPNSVFVKNKVNVLARRGDQRIPWRREVDFNVAYDAAPVNVIAVIEAELARAEIPHVAKQPVPACALLDFDSSSVKYAVYYWLTDLSRDVWTDSQIRLHVFAALARNGLEIPIPRQTVILASASEAKRRRDYERELDERANALERLELFDALTAEERRALAAELKPAPFVTDDLLMRQGETADSLFILVRGHVDIALEPEGASFGTRQRLTSLAAPAYFGEMGLLTGQPRAATVIAQGEVLCYRLEKSGFEAILRARPEIADRLSQTLATRQAANDATLAALSADARSRAAGSRAGELLQRIRQFFALAG